MSSALNDRKDLAIEVLEASHLRKISNKLHFSEVKILVTERKPLRMEHDEGRRLCKGKQKEPEN